MQAMVNQEIMDVRVSTAVELIRSLYQVPMIKISDRKTTEEICRKYRFHPIQYYFNEKVLDMVRQNMEDSLVYHISDAFMVHFVLFSVAGVPYMLGPYSVQLLSNAQVHKMIKELGLNDLDREGFKVYLASFPYLQEGIPERIVESFIRIINPAEKTKEVRRIQYEGGHLSKESDPGSAMLQHQMLVERRYEVEHRFLEAVRRGDAWSAIELMHQLRNEVSYLTVYNSSIESYRIGAGITRTMVRITALQAGLPSYIIDRISSNNNAIVGESKTPEAIHIAVDQMVRDFCKAIREMRTSQYSALVLNILYRLHNDYAGEISMSAIAEAMNLSEGYMVSCFKKEMGMTPNVYLMKYRMQMAAMLLHSGSLSIGGISAQVGIQDANYFVKLFKKEFGETPSEYRKHHTS